MAAESEFFKWVGQAVVVGFGWFVVHRLSAARDLDKARRELVAKSADGLSDALNTLLADARAYHLETRSIPAELQIKMALQDVTMRTIGLSEVCSDAAALAQCRADLALIRRAVTGQHFEDEHFEPLPESDQQFQAIGDGVFRAKRSFLKLKHLQFSLAPSQADLTSKSDR